MSKTVSPTAQRAARLGTIGRIAFARVVLSAIGSMKIGHTRLATTRKSGIYEFFSTLHMSKSKKMKKAQAFYDLLRMAEALSPRAQYILHPEKDDLTPYFSTNQEIELYDSLLLKAEIAHLFGKTLINPEA